MTPTFRPDGRWHPRDAVPDYLAGVPVGQLLLAASGWLTLAAEQLPLGNPARVAAVFGFMLICPGLAISRLISRDTIERWMLTAALSTSLAILVSVAATVVRNNSMTLRLVVLAAITSIAVLAGNVNGAGGAGPRWQRWRTAAWRCYRRARGPRSRRGVIDVSRDEPVTHDRFGDS